MYGCGCYDPCGFGYAAPAYYPAPRGRGFAIVVVLFILLIIIGASRYPIA